MRTILLGSYNAYNGYSGSSIPIFAVYDFSERKVTGVHSKGTFLIKDKVMTTRKAWESLQWMKDYFKELN